MSKALWVVTPTAAEFTVVRRALRSLPENNRPRLAMCGMGMVQAAAFAAQLPRDQVGCLLLVGWAGGLEPTLHAGDFVLADSAVQAGKAPLACHVPSLNEKAARTGSLLTVAQVLRTPQEKQAAQSSGALAAEMEAYPLAEWASRCGVPFVHGRVILDARDESLPDPGSMLDGYGRARPLPLLRQVLARPATIGELLRLGRHVGRLNPRLEALALALVAALDSGPA